LYGADAVGGVVQVFTPGARDLSNEQTGWVELGAGSFNSRRVAAGAQGEQDGTRYNLAVDRFDTDGTEIREGSDDRGYDNTSAVARVTHRFDNDAEIGVFGFRAAGSTEFEGSSPSQKKVTDYAMQTAGVKGQLWVTERWLSKLILSDSRDENENFTDGNRDSIFNTRSRAANWQNVFALGDHQLVVGADYLQDLVDSTTLYLEDERDNSAGFAQLLLNFGAFDVQASGRYDDNEAYGSETTGGLALGYKLDNHHRLRAS
jgi:Outer membrane cobalamin receptor protein